MSYVIPRGTPVEIAQYGSMLCPHTTKRDLEFTDAIAESDDQLRFHDGYWVLVVSRGLVLHGDGGGPTADELQL